MTLARNLTRCALHTTCRFNNTPPKARHPLRRDATRRAFLGESRLFTYGQVAAESVVTGKPSRHAVAVELLRTASAVSDSASVPLTLEEAERLLQAWRSNKLVWIAWLLLSAIFASFYILFLEGFNRLFGAGAVVAIITIAMYFSPWFKTSDGLFTIMTFVVGTFITDFICAFLSLALGSRQSAAVGCGALMIVHGLISFYLFRHYKGVVAAAEFVEKANLPVAQTSNSREQISRL